MCVCVEVRGGAWGFVSSWKPLDCAFGHTLQCHSKYQYLIVKLSVWVTEVCGSLNVNIG